MVSLYPPRPGSDLSRSRSRSRSDRSWSNLSRSRSRSRRVSRPSATETDLTILLSFSGTVSGNLLYAQSPEVSAGGWHCCRYVHTKIQNVSSTAGIQTQRRITFWAVLRIHFLDVLVEAGLVRYVSAGKLQYTFPTKRKLKRFFADGALAPNERPVPSVPRAIHVQYPSHTVGAARLCVGREG